MAIEIVKLIDSPVHLNFTGGITPKGVYVAETTYNTGESVSYLGSSYVAIQETTGNLPTNVLYWQLLSLKGDGAITGGTTGQVLAKASNADFDNQWITPKSALADFSQDTSHRLVTDTLIENWNTAYGWGNHAGLYDPINSASTALSGHLSAFDHSLIATALQSETDPVFTAWDKSTGISITESQISDLKTYIQSSEKGANNGVATLDAGGKVPTTQLPATLLIYKGVWNATTNIPELLATDTTKKGWVYNVSVEGTQFGIDWKLGDWAIYNDSGVLEKSDNSDDVVSVNGQQGVVVLNADHISDTSTTNKFVTTAEKGIWNGKQDALGFTPENVASKKTTLTDSDSDYPTTRAVNTALGSKITWGGDNLASKGLIGTTSNQPIGFITNNTEKMTILADGSVGIGTNNPNQQLEITKNFRLPATVGTDAYGVIYKDGSRFIHDFNYGDNGRVTTGGYNTFIGVNAGNFTMGSSASETYHSSYNTGIGMYALYSNTTGYQNSVIGMNALRGNTTGYHNSAIGAYALRSNTTGNYNSAIGVYAGRYLSNGTTGRETGDYGLYLGYNSKASANGTNNEIVIGYDAIGKGSNTAAYGNSSMLKHIFEAGNVGIGTDNPSAKIHVVGNGTSFAGVFQSNQTTTSWSSTYAAFNLANTNATTDNHALFSFSDNTGVASTAGIGAKFTDRTKHYGDLYFYTKGTDGYNQRLYIQSGGNVGIGTTTPTAKLDVNSDILRLRVPKTPETSGSAGNKGDYCWDANYLYVCIDTNTWKRSLLETW